jgi:hypothetical protein
VAVAPAEAPVEEVTDEEFAEVEAEEVVPAKPKRSIPPPLPPRG